MKSRSKIVVRYAETDQMGIVHHSVYPIWYEVARTDFIKHLGVTYSEMEKSGIMLPVTEIHCRYLGVTRYEEELEVEASVESLSAARIAFHYAVYRRGETKPIHEGSSHHGFVDSVSFRPMNLKKRDPLLYEKLMQAMLEEKIQS